MPAPKHYLGREDENRYLTAPVGQFIGESPEWFSFVVCGRCQGYFPYGTFGCGECGWRYNPPIPLPTLEVIHGAA